MILRWFLSKTVRHAVAMRRHVKKLLNAQRDVLSPQAVEAVTGAAEELRQTAAAATLDKAALQKQMDNLEQAANKWLRPYPHTSARENIEVLLVALVVAMGIRTFFVQPFKIPTGSMQPTLYGVTPALGSGNQKDLPIPNRLARFYEYWIHGNSFFHEVAPEDGRLVRVKPPVRMLLFNLKQEYEFNGGWRTIWFPPDNLFERAGYRLGDYAGQVLNSPAFRRGDDIIRLKVLAGDHLFVDRLTFNFRHPRRGEIVVFETRGIAEDRRNRWGVPGDQFYIKRLVALGGEQVRIGADQHLIINGRRLDASTPRFENVYTFSPGSRESEYFGHLPIQLFEDGRSYDVAPKHFMVMGDNTRSSLDSRFFGQVSDDYVIGKSWFIYWPITERFGLGYR